MKHLKLYEEFSLRDIFKKKSSTEEQPSQQADKPSEQYTFEPNESILNMVEECQKMISKDYNDFENHVQSVTGDRGNVQYFPFSVSEKTAEMQKQIIDAAVKSGYKPVKPISSPMSGDDWMAFMASIAPTLRGMK